MILLLLVALFANRYAIVLATAAAVTIAGLFLRPGGQAASLAAGLDAVLLDIAVSGVIAVATGSAVYFGRKWIMRQVRKSAV